MSAPKQQHAKTMQQLEKQSLRQLPPANHQAERCLLGAILLEKDAIYRALEVFNPDDFHRKPHRQIFDAALAVIDRENALDLLLLRDELERRKELDEIGGPAYLAALVDQVPTAANIEHHAKVVHEKAIARRLLNASIEIASRCYNNAEDAETLLNDAEQKVFAISEDRSKKPVSHIMTAVAKSFDRIEACYNGEIVDRGLSTGFPDLDRVIVGLCAPDIITVAARPRMGKTSFAVNVLQYLSVKHHIPAAFFSLEMSEEQIGERLLCAEARVNTHLVRQWAFKTKPDAEEAYQRLEYAANVIGQAPLYIDDTPNISILELRAKTRRLVMDKQIKLIVIDHLTILSPAQRSESRHREVTECMRTLKAMAKEIDIPILLLCQLSRKLEDRKDKRPQLADLRESGSIEEYSDIVMFLHRDEVYEDTTPDNDGKAEMLVKKHRNGPEGDVPLFFNKAVTRFESLAADDERGPF